MEIALHEIYTKVIATDQRPGFKLIHEYPLSGKPPMMTHILKIKPEKNYCSQRCPEAIMAISKLSKKDKTAILEAIKSLSSDIEFQMGETSFNGKNYPKHNKNLHLNSKD
jgi:Ca2+-transporting ATPase